VTTVYLGLGANLGERTDNMRAALVAMSRKVRVTAVSSLYETDPVGPPQPMYYNAAAAIETELEPLELLAFLKSIERELGREPGSERNTPRPIDIDILLYGELVLDDEQLSIPHPRLEERSFVLVPLAEIAGDLRHPKFDRTIAELVRDIGSVGVRRVADVGWDGTVGREGRGVLGGGPGA